MAGGFLFFSLAVWGLCMTESGVAVEEANLQICSEFASLSWVKSWVESSCRRAEDAVLRRAVYYSCIISLFSPLH